MSRHHSLAALGPLLDPELLTPLAVAGGAGRVACLMERLPMAPAGGFECRLGGAGTIDVSLRVATGSSEMLELAAIDAASSGEGRSFPGAGVVELARRLTRPADPLREAVESVWLEVDGDAPDAGSVDCFLGLAEDAGAPPIVGEDASIRRQRASATVRDALEVLGAPVREASAALLDRVFEARPAGSAIAFIGAMTGRAADVGEHPELRVVLRRMPIDEVTSFLLELDWEWDHLPIVPLLALLRRHGVDLALQIALVPALGPKLGFELSFPEDDGARWLTLLGDLRGLGLVSPSDLAAAGAWPRRFHRDVSPEWPGELDARWNHLFRRINHLKLTYDAVAMTSARRMFVPPIEALVAHRALAAKIYLAYALDRRFPSPTIW